MRNVHRSVGRFARLWAVLGIALLLAASAPAAQRPVKDDAGFFSPDAISSAEAKLTQLKQQYNHTVMVETYPDLPVELRGRVDGNEGSKAAAYESFVQTRSYSLGADVYVMAIKSPGHLETYARSVSRAGLTPDGYQRMRDDLLSAFKSRQFDQGLTRLADSLFATAQAGPPAAAGAAPPARGEKTPARTGPAPAEATRSGGLFGMGGCVTFVIIGVVLLIVIRLIRGLFARRNPPPLPPGGYGQPGYGQGGYGAPGGYGQPGYGQGGGGFGRGLLGGVLGGLLGGYAGNQVFGQHHNDPSAGGDTSGGATDPGSSDLGAGGGDFGDTSGGGDFGGDGGGGDSGGGDSGGGGGDF